MRGRKKKTNPLRKNRCRTTPPFSPTRGFNIALIQFPPALEAKLNKLALHMFNLLKHRKPLLEEKPKLTSEIELLLVLGQLRPVLHEWPLGIIIRNIAVSQAAKQFPGFKSREQNLCIFFFPFGSQCSKLMAFGYKETRTQSELFIVIE